MAGHRGARRSRIPHALAAGGAGVLSPVGAHRFVAIAAIPGRRRLLHLDHECFRPLARFPVRVDVRYIQHSILPDDPAVRHHDGGIHVRTGGSSVFGKRGDRHPSHLGPAMDRVRIEPDGAASRQMADRPRWRRHLPDCCLALRLRRGRRVAIRTSHPLSPDAAGELEQSELLVADRFGDDRSGTGHNPGW